MNAEDMLITLLTNLIGTDIDDTKATVCCNNAISAIKEYIYKDEDNIVETYMYQIVQLAYYYYKSFNDISLESKSQGGRSVTLTKDIPDSIKRTLPRYVKPF